ncbi:MAG TPA: hypothetical protein VFF53_04180 [Geobacteraceae bacterium]|nr:hypothetical protein [Geobacteraceae bacterium]
MFGWFRKREEPLQEFADNREAFEYACAHLPNRILLEAVIPAIVEEEGRRGRDGERFFSIRLAAPNGGRELWACTLAEATGWPEIGDLVGFRIVTIAEDIAPDPTPIGYIAYVLAPVLAAGKRWQIARNLTPANIKQAVRF